MEIELRGGLLAIHILHGQSPLLAEFHGSFGELLLVKPLLILQLLEIFSDWGVDLFKSVHLLVRQEVESGLLCESLVHPLDLGHSPCSLDCATIGVESHILPGLPHLHNPERNVVDFVSQQILIPSLLVLLLIRVEELPVVLSPFTLTAWVCGLENIAGVIHRPLKRHLLGLEVHVVAVSNTVLDEFRGVDSGASQPSLLMVEDALVDHGLAITALEPITV